MLLTDPSSFFTCEVTSPWFEYAFVPAASTAAREAPLDGISALPAMLLYLRWVFVNESKVPVKYLHFFFEFLLLVLEPAHFFDFIVYSIDT